MFIFYRYTHTHTHTIERETDLVEAGEMELVFRDRLYWIERRKAKSALPYRVPRRTHIFHRQETSDARSMKRFDLKCSFLASRRIFLRPLRIMPRTHFGAHFSQRDTFFFG